MKILLALDPFGSSEKALTEALKQAKLQGAELVILAVAETFQDVEHSYGALTDVSKELFSKVKANAEKIKLSAIGQGIDTKLLTETGPSPAQNILDCAANEKVELIVMGSRDKKGLDRFLLGSVASKIVAHAPCSVIVVR